MNKEQVYDNQISPLMQQIISVCSEHGIAMIASFDIAHDGEGPNGEDCSNLKCSSHLPNGADQFTPAFSQAAKIIQGVRNTAPMMITTTHGDGSKTLTAVI